MSTGKINRKIDIKRAYIILTFLSLFVASLMILFSQGRLFRLFFFSDQNDSLMDFFNSLIEVHTGKPYKDFGVLYPPLANCFFYFLQLLVPESVKGSWPTTHKDTVYLVGTTGDIRMTQSCMVIFLVVFVLSIFAFITLIQKSHEEKSNLFILCLIFSYSMLQSIEHGNIIIIALVFSMVFCFYYSGEKGYLRELALLSLAISFGFKLYPAFFGILLIREKRVKDCIKAIAYAVILTVVPIMLLDGPSGFSLWINNVLSYGTDTASSLESCMRLIAIIIAITAIIYDLIMSFAKKAHNQLPFSTFLMVLTWLMILVSGNADGSTLIFVIIPFIFFCKEEKSINKYNIIDFIVYMCCLLPIGINKLEYYFLPFFILSGMIRKRMYVKNEGGSN